MGPWMEAFGVLAKVMGIVLGTMAVLVLGFAFFLDVWAKRTTQNRIYCFFIEQKHLFGKLLAEDGGKVFMGRGENKEEYLLDPNKQFWTSWPPGLPKFLQVPVRSHFYIRHNPEPYDPENLEAMISSRSLRLISDEAMLKQTWKDVRETTGVRGGMGSNANTWVLILIFITILLVGFCLYMIMGLQTDFTEFRGLLGG